MIFTSKQCARCNESLKWDRPACPPAPRQEPFFCSSYCATKWYEAVQFFYANAGYSYDPKTETAEQGRMRCAVLIATVEQWAEENGVSAEWRYDDDQSWDGDCPAPDELWGCIVRHGDQCASLWSIGDPSNEYRRVVEAELASELLSAQQDTLKDYAGMLS